MNRALEQAERKMEGLKKSTRSTLENLQDKLDRLDGNTDALERRRYEARKRQLEDQLKAARASGDSTAIGNLQKALSLNSQVFSKTSDKRKDEERDKRRRDSERRTTTVNESQRQRTETPSKVIRLEYPGGAVNVNVRNGDENKLLRALKQSGARSI